MQLMPRDWEPTASRLGLDRRGSKGGKVHSPPGTNSDLQTAAAPLVINISSGFLPAGWAPHSGDETGKRKYEDSSAQQPVLNHSVFQLARVMCSVATQSPRV